MGSEALTLTVYPNKTYHRVEMAQRVPREEWGSVVYDGQTAAFFVAAWSPDKERLAGTMEMPLPKPPNTRWKVTFTGSAGLQLDEIGGGHVTRTFVLTQAAPK